MNSIKIVLLFLILILIAGCKKEEKPKSFEELIVTPPNETYEEAEARLANLLDYPPPNNYAQTEALAKATDELIRYVRNNDPQRQRSKGGLDWDIILNILKVVATIVLVYVVYLKFVLKKDI